MHFQLGSLVTAGLFFVTAPVAAETLTIRDITNH